MQVPQSQPGQTLTSSATETSSRAFVETVEHKRFVDSATLADGSGISVFATDLRASARHSPLCAIAAQR